jgi:hypothetical protein
MTEEQIIKRIMKAPSKKVEDNPLFLHMVETVKEVNSRLGDFINIEEGEITTAVHVKNKTTCITHNFMCITLPDGSHIRFAPKNKKDVEITRIISNNPCNGNGTLLMDIVMEAYMKSRLNNVDGDIVLECTGSVGLRENTRVMNISKQAAFFRKFGFRMVGKYDPSHINMKLKNFDYIGGLLQKQIDLGQTQIKVK